MLPIASSTFQLCSGAMSGALSTVTAPMTGALGLPNNGAASRYIPPVARTAMAASLLGCDDGQRMAGMCVAGIVGMAALYVVGRGLFFHFFDREESTDDETVHARNREEATRMEVEFKRVAMEGGYQSVYELKRYDDTGVHWEPRDGWSKQDLVGKDIIFIRRLNKPGCPLGSSVHLHSFKIIEGRCTQVSTGSGGTILSIDVPGCEIPLAVRLTATGYENRNTLGYDGPVWYRDPV